MSHTNTTTNYGLPQFLSSDKPAWMADINVAFSDIDTQMKTNADAASAAQTTANDAVLNGAPGYSNLSTYAVGDVVNYLGRVYKCDIAVTTPEAFDNAKWSYYRLSDASAQLDVIDGEIGNTDISGIGDGTITGAISSLNPTIVWTNQNPGDAFAAQTISVDLSNYSHVLISGKDGCAIARVGESTSITLLWYNNGIVGYGRSYEIRSSGILVTDCTGLHNGITTNSRCVPLNIYGLSL